MAGEWHDMRTDAERLKELYERLDTIWVALDGEARYRPDPDKPDATDWDTVSQEFLGLLDDLARGAQSSEMWALVGRWAGEKA